MKYQFLCIWLCALPIICSAGMEGSNRSVPKVQNPAMVIDDRGTEIEVLPDRRAVIEQREANKQAVRRVVMAKPGAGISPRNLGVVFNHSMQVYGYLTGEIAFKLKRDEWSDAASLQVMPGFKRLTPDGVYLVVARTPSEVVEWTREIQSKNAVQWVEPIVLY